LAPAKLAPTITNVGLVIVSPGAGRAAAF